MTANIWEIEGNFWLNENILDGATAAGVARGILLLSQANYFAARACLSLATGGFAQLGIKRLPKGMCEDILKRNKVPLWGNVTKYLCEAVESLRNIPDQNGPVNLAQRRDAVYDSISEYNKSILIATPFRDAICHGVLTVDEGRETVLHPTGTGCPFSLREKSMEFITQSAKAYSAASSLILNISTLEPLVSYEVTNTSLEIVVNNADEAPEG